MESLKCPICNKTDLKMLKNNSKSGRYYTVCENEDYSHLRQSGSHYLLRSRDNIIDEMKDSVGKNAMFALN
jgi:hypothetical protein